MFFRRFAHFLVFIIPVLAACVSPAHSEAANVSESEEELLSELPIEELTQVKVVTASRSEETPQFSPGIVEVISRSDIQRLGALSLAEVIDHATSIFVTGTTFIPGENVVIRGDTYAASGNSRVLFLLDSRPFRDSFLSSAELPLLYAIPLSTVERIEIVRGPGSVIYGTDAYLGVINIITKKSTDRNSDNHPLFASFKAGSYSTFSGELSGGVEQGDLTIDGGGMALSTGGWPYTLTDEKGVTHTFDESSLSAGGLLNIQYKGLRSSTYAGTSNPKDVGQPPVWLDPFSSRCSMQRVFSNLEYARQFTDDWNASLDFTFNLMNFGQGQTDAPQYIYQYHSDDYLFETIHHVSVSHKFNLLAGGIVDLMTGKGIQNSLTSSGATYNLFSGKNPDPYVVVPYYRFAPWELYAQMEYKLTDFTKLVFGGQMNKVPDVALNLVPRAAFIGSWTSGWGTKVLYGGAYRTGSALERGVEIPNTLYGNQSLSPETIATYEAQVSYHANHYDTALTYFYSHQNDVIQRSLPGQNIQATTNGTLSPPGVPVYINGGTIQSQGLELEGRGAPSRSVTLTGGLSYLWFNDPLGMPGTQIKLGMLLNPIDPLRFSLFDNYFGRFKDINAKIPDANHPVGSYHDVSFNLEYDATRVLLGAKSTRHLVFNFSGKNIFSEPIFFPEFLRKIINSFPGQSNIGLFGGVTATF